MQTMTHASPDARVGDWAIGAASRRFRRATRDHVYPAARHVSPPYPRAFPANLIRVSARPQGLSRHVPLIICISKAHGDISWIVSDPAGNHPGEPPLSSGVPRASGIGATPNGNRTDTYPIHIRYSTDAGLLSCGNDAPRRNGQHSVRDSGRPHNALADDRLPHPSSLSGPPVYALPGVVAHFRVRAIAAGNCRVFRPKVLLSAMN
jgi:hypothetical protein